MSTDVVPLGGDPLAAVFGGIVALGLAAFALVIRREHLRSGRELSSAVWIASGAYAAVNIYFVGLLIGGRGPDLVDKTVPWGFPWALLLLAGVGGTFAYCAGSRAGWHWAGVAGLGSLLLASVGWGAYLVTTRVATLIGAPTLMAGALVALLLAQLTSLLLVCAVAAYALDRLVRRRWVRDAAVAPRDAAYRPRVAVHVASYNEPPELVVRTLDSLVAQEYPRELLHIMLADDSTDAGNVEILREACVARGITFLHREERTGFKAGALNAALRATPEDVELIAIIDADFVCDNDYLAQTVGYFVDDKLAFLQTRLAYSNSDDSFTARYATLMEGLFYSSMMHTRNESNAILFAGTMGILRKRAVVAVGGWTDGHVGEDIDLSCRLLMAEWKSLYVPTAYGYGLQTADHESFRRQQARWAYGGARIMRDHGRAIVKGKMTPGQKAHYLYGPLFWLDGSLGLTFAAGMVFFALAFLTGNTERLPVRDLAFVGLIPILIIFEGMFRAAFTMRRLLGVGLRDVAAMVLMGWSGKVANAFSAWTALFGISRPFYRTPKHDTPTLTRASAAWQAVRGAPFESAVAALQLVLCAAMTIHLVVAGPGAVPLVLIVAAILMTVLWTCYFGAAALCTYLGHASKRARIGRFPGPSLSAQARATQA